MLYSLRAIRSDCEPQRRPAAAAGQPRRPLLRALFATRSGTSVDAARARAAAE